MNKMHSGSGRLLKGIQQDNEISCECGCGDILCGRSGRQPVKEVFELGLACLVEDSTVLDEKSSGQS